MHYEPTDTAAMARTSNLNEELGQVEKVTGSNSVGLTIQIIKIMWGLISTNKQELYSSIFTCLLISFLLILSD